MRVITLNVSKVRQSPFDQMLRSNGIEVDAVASVDGLLCRLRKRLPDAVLLGDSGPLLADWLAALKIRVGAELPVLVIGAPGGGGIVEALAHGAVDYLDHEMPMDLLVARLHAHAAKSQIRVSSITKAGPFTLYDTTMTLQYGGVEISLTQREYMLARILFSNVGRVVPLSSLSSRVWGVAVDISKRTLEQHIYKLRRKIESRFSTMVRIHAAYGIGYRLDLLMPEQGVHVNESFDASRRKSREPPQRGILAAQ